MFGIVSHRYPNGDLDVWFATQKFGATYFCSEGDGTAELVEGQRVQCDFDGHSFGTVVRIVAAPEVEEAPRAAKPSGTLRQRMMLLKQKHKLKAKQAKSSERVA